MFYWIGLASGEREQLCGQKARPWWTPLRNTLQSKGAGHNTCFQLYRYSKITITNLRCCWCAWFFDSKNIFKKTNIGVSGIAKAKLWPLKPLTTTTKTWHCFCSFCCPAQGTLPDPRFQTSKWHAQRFLRSLGEEPHSWSRRQQGNLRLHLRFHINQHHPLLIKTREPPRTLSLGPDVFISAPTIVLIFGPMPRPRRQGRRWTACSEFRAK